MGDAELGKTRSETAAGKPKEENGDAKVENGENGETEDDEKPAITREGTMAATAEVRIPSFAANSSLCLRTNPVLFECRRERNFWKTRGI